MHTIRRNLCPPACAARAEGARSPVPAEVAAGSRPKPRGGLEVGTDQSRRTRAFIVDELSFEQVVEMHYQSLYRFAFGLTGRESDAWDLTQQTFYRWATKGQQLRDKSKVKSWLFTTLHREFLNARRHEGRFPQVEAEAADQQLPPEPPAAPRALDGQIVIEALARVDEPYRAPLVLFYLEDHSYREIADILGVPPGTVMSRLARGKAQLRQLLADRETGGPAAKTDTGKPSAVNVPPPRSETDVNALTRVPQQSGSVAAVGLHANPGGTVDNDFPFLPSPFGPEFLWGILAGLGFRLRDTAAWLVRFESRVSGRMVLGPAYAGGAMP